MRKPECYLRPRAFRTSLRGLDDHGAADQGLLRCPLVGHIPNVMASSLVGAPSMLRAGPTRDDRYRIRRVALTPFDPLRTFKCGVFPNCSRLRHFEEEPASTKRR
jgi:hypothetical protein